MELRPCKKCGGKGAIFTGFDFDSTAYVWDTYEVRCTDCGWHTKSYDSKDEAIYDWNLRVDRYPKPESIFKRFIKKFKSDA